MNQIRRRCRATEAYFDRFSRWIKLAYLGSEARGSIFSEVQRAPSGMVCSMSELAIMHQMTPDWAREPTRGFVPAGAACAAG